MIHRICAFNYSGLRNNFNKNINKTNSISFGVRVCKDKLSHLEKTPETELRFIETTIERAKRLSSEATKRAGTIRDDVTKLFNGAIENIRQMRKDENQPYYYFTNWRNLMGSSVNQPSTKVDNQTVEFKNYVMCYENKDRKKVECSFDENGHLTKYKVYGTNVGIYNSPDERDCDETFNFEYDKKNKKYKFTSYDIDTVKDEINPDPRIKYHLEFNKIGKLSSYTYNNEINRQSQSVRITFKNEKAVEFKVDDSEFRFVDDEKGWMKKLINHNI